MFDLLVLTPIPHKKSKSNPSTGLYSRPTTRAFDTLLHSVYTVCSCPLPTQSQREHSVHGALLIHGPSKPVGEQVGSSRGGSMKKPPSVTAAPADPLRRPECTFEFVVS